MLFAYISMVAFQKLKCLIILIFLLINNSCVVFRFFSLFFFLHFHNTFLIFLFCFSFFCPSFYYTFTFSSNMCVCALGRILESFIKFNKSGRSSPHFKYFYLYFVLLARKMLLPIDIVSMKTNSNNCIALTFFYFCMIRTLNKFYFLNVLQSILRVLRLFLNCQQNYSLIKIDKDKYNNSVVTSRS